MLCSLSTTEERSYARLLKVCPASSVWVELAGADPAPRVATLPAPGVAALTDPGVDTALGSDSAPGVEPEPATKVPICASVVKYNTL